MGQGVGVGEAALVDSDAVLPDVGVWAMVVGTPVLAGVGAPVGAGVGVALPDGRVDGIVVGVVEAGADSVVVSGVGWGLVLVGLLVTGVGSTGLLATGGGRTRT